MRARIWFQRPAHVVSDGPVAAVTGTTVAPATVSADHGFTSTVRRSAVAPAVSVRTCRAVSGNEDVLPGCIADVTVIVGLADASTPAPSG